MKTLSFGLLALLLVPAPLAAQPRLEAGFWRSLVAPKASWLLEERASDKGAKPSSLRAETYDCRTVANASVARLRWTQVGAKKDVGDSNLGRYTQVAVTAAGIYLLSADMDDAAVAKALKRKPSRSDPPRAYAGNSRNQGRFLSVEAGKDGPIACMGAPTPRESDGDPTVGEVCFSATKGIVFLGGGYAPGGRIFTQVGYEKRALATPIDVEAAAPTVNTLLVAGPNGIQEVDLEGKVLRTISKTSAGKARYLANREGVLFEGPDGDLWLTTLADSNTKRLAKLPKQFKACEEMPDYPKGHRFARADMSAQDETDFQVDKGGELACLGLSDRNDNMANFRVQLAIDLKTGKVRTFGTGCKGTEADGPSCESTDWLRIQPAPVNRAKFPYGLASGRLVKREPDGKTTRVVKLGTGDFEEDRLSPSGTWVTIRGNQIDGDYIHFDLFLLSRADGRVWPVSKTKLAPLTTKQLANLDKSEIETEGVVGETSIHWLPGRDLLLVDGNLLVQPGVGAVELPGSAVF